MAAVRSTQTVVGLAALASAALLLTGCGQPAQDAEPTGGAQPRLELTGHGQGSDPGYPEALLTRTAEGTVEGSTACVEVTPSGGDRYLLVWPDGYTALDDPLRVLNENDDVVLTVGEEVELGGGETGEDGTCGEETSRTWMTAPIG